MAIYVIGPSNELAQLLEGAADPEIVRVASADALPAAEEIGLVLIDLPAQAGVDACRAVRARQGLEHVPVIVVTERGDPASVDRVYEAGASDYLPRPFSRVELLGRVRSELELARQVEQGIVFQSALLELATLQEQAFDETLRHALRVVARALGVARVGYWQFENQHRSIRAVELFLASEQRFEQGMVLGADAFPRYFAALEEGTVVAAEDACSDPRTSEFAEVYLMPLGIGAMLDVPVFVRGAFAGVLCHEHVGPPRPWRLEERQFAFSVGQILSIVVEAESRRSAERALRESRAHLETVIETALDAVITMDREGRVEGWNARAESLFGLKREEVLGKELATVAVPAMRELLAKLGDPGASPPGTATGLRVELAGKTKDGDDLPLEVSVASFALSGA
ncbi:MAG TPA: PAS domain S-box protein, partial [Polyangiaceae bacterium]|nr:PAS domain S-box protein [Polyangiaceae bacterium]